MIFTRLRVMAIILLSLSLAGSAVAQPYRLLTATDFQGTARANYGSVVAYTNCSISYNYRVRRDNGVFHLTFNVPMVMNRNLSWMNFNAIQTDAMLAEVLKHEQGHYIIAYLQQQEIIRTFNRTAFGRDYNIMANDIFNRIDAKYKQLNSDYETETNHMVNRVQQASWDKYLARCLYYLPPLTASN